jgi:hypothetical protein
VTFDLTGDLLTGSKTYDWQKEIKSLLGGVWDSKAHGYRVDPEKVERALAAYSVFRSTPY